MCHISPRALFFRTPLSAIFVFPIFFLYLHHFPVYDVPLCSSFSISPEHCTEIISVRPSFYFLYFSVLAYLTVNSSRFHFSIYLSKRCTKSIFILPSFILFLHSSYSIDMFLCFLFSISPYASFNTEHYTEKCISPSLFLVLQSLPLTPLLCSFGSCFPFLQIPPRTLPREMYPG